MISQEECNEATAAPIVLRKGSEQVEGESSYAVMWTRHEMEEMGGDIPEHSGGIAVVSSLNLPLQQYLENAVETALTAVEKPEVFPEAWLEGAQGEAADAIRKSFSRMKRPDGLKVRGMDNNLDGLLQCCALVVDSRRNQRGKILALVGGRSIVDGRDRWQDTVMPGRVAAPFLFCCACLPGGDDMHIVARSTEVTGVRLGYDVVKSFYDSLKLPLVLPKREQERELYNGHFPIRKLDLARLLFCLQNEGRGYRLSLVNTIWSSNEQVIYNYEPEKSPEYIRRESATAVSVLPPFRLSEGEPTTMNETLPNGGGQWVMVYRPNSVCVFVWMGYDKAGTPEAMSGRLRALLSRAAMSLGREIYNQARTELRAAAQKSADAGK